MEGERGEDRGERVVKGGTFSSLSINQFSFVHDPRDYLHPTVSPSSFVLHSSFEYLSHIKTTLYFNKRYKITITKN